MAKFETSQIWADGDQVTSTKLNLVISGLSAGADLAADGTITVSSGAIRVGTITAGNYGALSIPTAAYQAASITSAKLASEAVETANIKLLNVTGATIAEATIPWTKTLAADRAVAADMQAESAAHFVSPDVLKHHPGVSKAGGVLNMASGSIAGAHGVSSSASGSSTSRTVTLSATMENTNYRVLITPGDTGTIANAPVITAKTTSSFTIASGSNTIDFSVFGQLA